MQFISLIIANYHVAHISSFKPLDRVLFFIKSLFFPRIFFFVLSSCACASVCLSFLEIMLKTKAYHMKRYWYLWNHNDCNALSQSLATTTKRTICVQVTLINVINLCACVLWTPCLAVWCCFFRSFFYYFGLNMHTTQALVNRMNAFTTAIRLKNVSKTPYKS